MTVETARGATSVEQIKIEPGTETYYEKDPDFFITVALEVCEEWSYENDPHGYCHERSVLVGLVREIERLRASDRPT